jgi:protein gp37
MGQFTNIPWSDSTWNPIRGCDKVSIGCKNCYIITTPVFRFSKMKHGDPRVKAGAGTWGDPIRWNKKPWICNTCGKACDLRVDHDRPDGTRCYAPCTDSGARVAFHRARVFSLSLGDWLDPKIPIEWLAQMLDVIRQCENLDFLLCTKRAEFWSDRLHQAMRVIHNETDSWISRWLDGEAPNNVWVLASAENQEMLNKRVPELLRIPAVVRGLSCEPLLGPLNLDDVTIKHAVGEQHFSCIDLEGDNPKDDEDFHGAKVSWVIAGGESGLNARPCQVGWIRDIQKRCEAAGVAYFCKQLGSQPRTSGEVNHQWCDDIRMGLKHKKGGDPSEWDTELQVREFPTVDGR